MPAKTTETGTAVMRSAVIAAPRTLQIQKHTIPSIGPDQVLVRLEGCGVCASNVPTWQGREWFQYPIEPGAPGHEGWGVIERLGAEVTTFQPGDRVAILSSHSFAEYDVAHVNETVLLPASLENYPAPGEPLGCAANIFRRSEIQSDQIVAIVGIGFLGALLTELATAAGADVIAISRRNFALDLAADRGAKHCLRFDDPQSIINQVREITGHNGCPRVVEAVGNQIALDVCSELVGTRGRLIVAGYHQDGPRTINMQSWNWRGIDVINAHERDPAIYLQGMREAFQFIAEGKLDPRPLMTHQFPLEELPQALDISMQRPEGFLKALITFDSKGEPPDADFHADTTE